MSADVPSKYASLPRFAFGDGPALANELLALVLSGKKTATCCSLSQYQAEGWEIPTPGYRWIVLDGAKHPRCVVETTDCTTKRFDEVDAQFAHDEGEGDQTYAWWRSAHEKYFQRQGVYAPDMMVVCERFRLVEVFEPVKENVR